MKLNANIENLTKFYYQNDGNNKLSIFYYKIIYFRAYHNKMKKLEW